MIDYIEKIAKGAATVDLGYFSQVNKETEGTEGVIAGPVSLQRVKEAEDRLDVMFPNEYRDFLLTYGSLLYRGMEIFGLTPCGQKDGGSVFIDVVAATLRMRQHGELAENEKFVAVSTDGLGTYFLLDTVDPVKAVVIARSPDIEDLVIATGLSKFVEGYLYDTYAKVLNDASC